MKKPYIWGIILLMVIGVAVVYFVFDPSSTGWFPKCAIYQLTGYKCPGCGSQRMLHALLHADLTTAFRYNAFLLTLFPVLLVLLLWSGWQKWMSRKWADFTVNALVFLFLLTTILWWALRNVFGW